jgi:hypothetical protein
MPDSHRVAMPLAALALLLAVAGILALAPVGTPARAPAAPAAPASPIVPAGHHLAAAPFELVLFGSSHDGERLRSDAAPLLVHRVPADVELWITDVDATSIGLVLWRGTPHHREQVGFIVDHAAVGLGQSARSYATGIRFGPGDELLVGPAGGDVEWAALRGLVVPLPPLAGT